MDRTDIDAYREEIRTGLIDAGKRLEEGQMIQQQALADIAQLIEQSDGLISRTEMARLARIERKVTYQLVPKGER